MIKKIAIALAIVMSMGTNISAQEADLKKFNCADILELLYGGGSPQMKEGMLIIISSVYGYHSNKYDEEFILKFDWIQQDLRNEVVMACINSLDAERQKLIPLFEK